MFRKSDAHYMIITSQILSFLIGFIDSYVMTGPILRTSTQYIDCVEILNISPDLSGIYFAHFSWCRAFFVCSSHSILECCVMFSRVKLNIRSFVLSLNLHRIVKFYFFLFSGIYI